ncbi:MAG: DUF1385 domain-containing protein [Dehalococcoidia bacterium]|nr:MAG: DUF1385 domain-containing protein [Dehalococcoidia bacterium]
MAKRFYYGGQAVIEGVMMRGRKAAVIAVRRPNGEVVIEPQPLPAISTGKARRIPLIRGVVVLIESMVLGIKALLHSANLSMEEEEEKEKISGGVAWGAMIGSVALVVALFILAPLFLANLEGGYIQSSIVFHLIEGFIRLGIFIAYLKSMTLSPSIRRVFAYHGAEHKVVNAYEAGIPLEIEAVKKYSTAHVRCGTSFLFIVLMIAIIVFALIGRPSLGVMVLSRVVLIPAIAALGYEATYFGARHSDSRLVKAFLAPGLWLQGLTTSEPDDSQLEVALSALKRMVEIDGVGEAAQASS